MWKGRDRGRRTDSWPVPQHPDLPARGRPQVDSTIVSPTTYRHKFPRRIDGCWSAGQLFKARGDPTTSRAPPSPYPSSHFSLHSHIPPPQLPSRPFPSPRQICLGLPMPRLTFLSCRDQGFFYPHSNSPSLYEFSNKRGGDEPPPPHPVGWVVLPPHPCFAVMLQ